MAHLVFPGRTADVVGFREGISYLEGELGLSGVVACCDRRMVSQGNLEALREAGLSYIVAVRMRRGRDISRAGRYQVVAEDLWVKEVNMPGEERYILCYNPVGAEEDKRAREVAMPAFRALKMAPPKLVERLA